MLEITFKTVRTYSRLVNVYEHTQVYLKALKRNENTL